MSDLKATEFDEILGGDFEIPCYVNMDESFKHAIVTGRPIVVLYGEEAAQYRKEVLVPALASMEHLFCTVDDHRKHR